MSGFGLNFTPLMRTGGASDIATFGTGGDYADMAAVIAANLADTYIRNTDTGRLYLTDSGGYPIGADVAALGTLTLRSEIVGTEANAAAATGVSESSSGSGAVTWSPANGYVTLSTASDSDTAALTMSPFAGSLMYFAGEQYVVSRDTDANSGYFLTMVFLGDGSNSVFVFPSTDTKALFGDGGFTPLDRGAIRSENVGAAWAWVEILFRPASAGGAVLWIDGTPQAVANNCFSTFRVSRLGDLSGDGGGNGEVRWRNVRGYTIA